MIDQKTEQMRKTDRDATYILKELQPYMPGVKIPLDFLTPEELNELSRQNRGVFLLHEISGNTALPN